METTEHNNLGKIKVRSLYVDVSDQFQCFSALTSSGKGLGIDYVAGDKQGYSLVCSGGLAKAARVAMGVCWGLGGYRAR